MRRSVIAANWKMHGSRSFVREWFVTFREQGFDTSLCDIVVCPPFPYLEQAYQEQAYQEQAYQEQVSDAAKQNGIKTGAQDISDKKQGAYTGQVSAEMLIDNGCSYVIIGHSERRALNAETDILIAQKVACALEANLIPILCVGETLEQRKQNQTEQVVARQLSSVLEILKVEQIATLVIAYEPVWAIGTGLAATAEQAQAVHAFLRQEISKRDLKLGELVRIIYGGSVKPDNAAELLAMPDIDGALVGGASLDAAAFAQIIKSAK